MRLTFGALSVWLAIWALLVLLTGWFDLRSQAFLLVPVLGLGYGVYASRAYKTDLDPVRTFRQFGKVAAVLGAIIGATWAEGRRSWARMAAGFWGYQ
jgi:hypothetical protein